jgi:PHD/YefM family antitoxin component YafN of YafNO toxin-antitoxin module
MSAKGENMAISVEHREDGFVVDARGRKTGVILSLRRYARLMEDLQDLAVVAERRSEKTVSLAEMERRLKRDGVL